MTKEETRPRILIAGIGNIFLGDDAFGVEVVQRLARRELPREVRVVDYGIRGWDLAYGLLDAKESVILVDATPRGGEPGTLYVLELDSEEFMGEADPSWMFDAHSLDPARVLRLVAVLGGRVRCLLVGCEPDQTRDEEDMLKGLSPPVQAAVGEAVVLIEEIAGKILSGESKVLNGISEVK